jgi:hypothetical protein
MNIQKANDHDCRFAKGADIDGTEDHWKVYYRFTESKWNDPEGSGRETECIG